MQAVHTESLSCLSSKSEMWPQLESSRSDGTVVFEHVSWFGFLDTSVVGYCFRAGGRWRVINSCCVWGYGVVQILRAKQVTK